MIWLPCGHDKWWVRFCADFADSPFSHWSVQMNITIISQQAAQPYFFKWDGSGIKTYRKYGSDTEITTAQKCALSVLRSLYYFTFPADAVGCELTAITSQMRFGRVALSFARSIWGYHCGRKLLQEKCLKLSSAEACLERDRICYTSPKGQNLNYTFGKVISQSSGLP